MKLQWLQNHLMRGNLWRHAWWRLQRLCALNETDFWLFGGLGQPIEAQSTVFYYFFSWWHFDHHRGVCGVGANDGYHNSSWCFYCPCQSTRKSRSGLLPAWLQIVRYQWSGYKQVLRQNSERKCGLQMADVIFGLFAVFCIRKRCVASH